MSSDRVAPVRTHCYCAVLPVLLLLASGCSDEIDDGLTKFPVTGTVLVDGKPRDGIRVRFFRDGKPGRTNADTPAAVTDNHGRFALSTNGDADGAVAGTYKVIFFWKHGNAPGTPDMLGGQYSKLDKTPFEVTIVEGENELPAFELKRDESVASSRPKAPPSLPSGNRGGRR